MNQKIIKYLKHYFYEYGLQSVILLSLAIAVGSLLTFHPHDESLLYHARYAQNNNFFGYFGATCAGLLVYFFGSASYIFILYLMYVSSFMFRTQTMKQQADRLVGGCLLVITSAMLCNLYQVGFYEFSSFGGLFGQQLARFFSYFDLSAKFLIAYILQFVSLVLIARFAHLKVSQWIARALEAVVHYAVQVDHMPAKFIRKLAAMIATCCYGVGYAFTYCVELVNGAFINKSASSIVEFERDEPVDQDVDSLMQEMFGQQTDQNVHEELFDNQEDVPHVQQDQSYYAQQDMSYDDMPGSQKKDSMQAENLKQEIKKVYSLPDVETMLSQSDQIIDDSEIDQAVLDEQSAILEEKLGQFGIKGRVVRVHPGPVITMFEYQPESHIKLSKILSLEDDLAMALQAINIRILAPIPGKPVVGFEVANKVRKPVLLSDIFHSKAWTQFEGSLPLILGEDTHGDHVVVDLASMPHVLIAGSTGSGKSVAVNCMLVSLLCAKSPEQVRLIIIDPKQLEFSSYEDIAHLLFPIVTDSKKAVPVLRWLVTTMEERYELMAEHGVKNIFEYQKLAEQDKALPDMPFIVLIIDELADLMMTTGKDVEDLIARIAQMSRAAGIHMVVATQRPSVDVITGLIKVNFPNRISFKVTSKVDSRTILDHMGAERLLGKGDMLFIDSKDPEIRRVHGAYVSNKEINFLVNHIKHQQDVAYFDLSELLTSEASNEALLEADQELYNNIVEAIKDYDEISISMIQRKFRIGYNRSARLIEALEADGLILPNDGGKMRRVIKD